MKFYLKNKNATISFDTDGTINLNGDILDAAKLILNELNKNYIDFKVCNGCVCFDYDNKDIYYLESKFDNNANRLRQYVCENPPKIFLEIKRVFDKLKNLQVFE